MGVDPGTEEDPRFSLPAMNGASGGVPGEVPLRDIVGTGIPQARVPIGTERYRAVDARGREGTVAASFYGLNIVPPDLAARVGFFNIEGRIGDAESGPLLQVLEDYSPWSDYADIRVLVHGLAPLGPLPDGACVRTYRSHDGGLSLDLLVLLETVSLVGRRALITVDIEWRIGLDGRFHSKFSAHGLPPDTLELPTALKRAARTVAGIRVVPGPKPGTVKGEKYKTPEEWYAALNEHVRPRSKRVTADEHWFAARLDISKSHLYVLMDRWGPPGKIKDLREGNF